MRDSAVRGLMTTPAFAIAPGQNSCCLVSGSRNGVTGRILFRYPATTNGNILISPAISKGLVVNPDTVTYSGDRGINAATPDLSDIHATTTVAVPKLGCHRGVHAFTNVHTGASQSSFVVRRTTPHFVSLTNVGSPNLSSTMTVKRCYLRLLRGDNLRTARGTGTIAAHRGIGFHRLATRRGTRTVGRGPLCNQMVYHYRAVARKRVISTLRSPVPPAAISNVGHHYNTNVNHYRNNFYNPQIIRVVTHRHNVDPVSIGGSITSDRVLMSHAGGRKDTR